jgi:aspartate kinase
MAAHFRAERCEIRKDVDGVYSADPNQIEDARHIANLHYDLLLDMTFWGAKVLHYRSVELAAVLKIPLLVGLAHGEGRSTMINGEAEMYEQAQIVSVNTHKDVRWVRVKKSELSASLAELGQILRQNNLPHPQMLATEKDSCSCSFLITAPVETLNAMAQLNGRCDFIHFESAADSSVTVTCQGGFASPLTSQIAEALEKNGIEIRKLIFGAMSITAVVNSNQRDAAVRIIHNLKPETVTAI